MSDELKCPGCDTVDSLSINSPFTDARECYNCNQFFTEEAIARYNRKLAIVWLKGPSGEMYTSLGYVGEGTRFDYYK